MDNSEQSDGCVRRQKGNRLLLVGWDAADWRVVHPLIDSGKMPTLGRIVEQGAAANIASLNPMLSPMLWTSIATGKRPPKHGVLGFTEPMPGDTGVRPVSGRARRCKAVWDILSESGKRCLVVGWWPSHPAEQLNGVMVSNEFHQLASRNQPESTEGAVWPPDLEPALRKLRVRPEQLLAEHILPFVPRAAEVNQSVDRRLGVCARILAECTTVNAVATELLAQQDWDFAAVYFDAIDHFCHAFMPYHPPRLPHVREEDFEIYRGVVEAAYRYHDLMLRSLVKISGPDTTVVVVSDHGFNSGDQRSVPFPDEPAGPAHEHRRLGVFAAAGPNIVRDQLAFGLSVLDVTPLVLTHFDLPVGDDMDGRLPIEVLRHAEPPPPIASWESVGRPRAQRGWESSSDANKRSDAMMRRLVELGYVDAPPASAAAAAQISRREQEYNLARSYMDAGAVTEAFDLLRRLCAAWPNEFRFLVQLSYCLLALGDDEELERVVAKLVRRRKESANAAKEELRRIAQEARSPGDDAPTADGQALRRLLARSRVHFASTLFLQGCVALAQRRTDDAIALFEDAISHGAANVALFTRAAEALLQTGRLQRAEWAYRQVLAIDEKNPQALLGLARTRFAIKDYSAAAEYSLQAIGAQYHFPTAHYTLGRALLRLRRPDAAVDALERAIEQNPRFRRARRLLAWVLGVLLQDPAAARAALQSPSAAGEREEARPPHNLATPPSEAKGGRSRTRSRGRTGRTPSSGPAGAQVTDLDRLVIVSGFPRSGTSMAMAMLVAGGIPATMDDAREPDASNPEGYYEDSRVKRLAADNGWLARSVGSCVKVITQLLPYVPEAIPADVIYMERPIEEVLASQEAMLRRQEIAYDPQERAALRAGFRAQQSKVLSKVAVRSDTRLLRLEYRGAVSDPLESSRAIARFLGVRLDVAAMASVVDAGLHRVRLDG